MPRVHGTTFAAKLGGDIYIVNRWEVITRRLFNRSGQLLCFEGNEVMSLCVTDRVISTNARKFGELN